MDMNNEIKGIMKAPKAPGEMKMGGVRKGGNDFDIGSAVKTLNMQTERGSHAPMVGGYKHDCYTH